MLNGATLSAPPVPETLRLPVATPEVLARAEIDRLLGQAGWTVCDVGAVNLHASRGVAIREFPLAAGFGFADYLLYVNGKAVGVIEAKKQGATLTGVETHFINGLDPSPRAINLRVSSAGDALGVGLRRDEVLPEWALIWMLSPGGRYEIEQMASSTSGRHTLYGKDCALAYTGSSENGTAAPGRRNRPSPLHRS